MEMQSMLPQAHVVLGSAPGANPQQLYPQSYPPQHPYPQIYPQQPYPQQPYPQRATSFSQTTVIGGAAPQPTVIVQQAPVRPSSYMALSCVVIWFCGNLVFGLIAFIFSVLSQSAADFGEARTMGKISLGLNITGIITSILGAVGIVVWYFLVLLPSYCIGYIC